MDAVSAKTNPLNVGNVSLITSIEPSIRLHHSCYVNISIYKRVYSSGRGYKREKTAWTFRTEPTCLHYCLFWAWDRHFKCPLQITLLCQILTRVSGYSKVIQLKKLNPILGCPPHISHHGSVPYLQQQRQEKGKLLLSQEYEDSNYKLASDFEACPVLSFHLCINLFFHSLICYRIALFISATATFHHSVIPFQQTVCMEQLHTDNSHTSTLLFPNQFLKLSSTPYWCTNSIISIIALTRCILNLHLATWLFLFQSFLSHTSLSPALIIMWLFYQYLYFSFFIIIIFTSLDI